MNGKAELFYDGGCGLCHRAVGFILNRGKRGTDFRFAPLDGETFQLRLSPEQRAGLPDSLVLITASGEVLLRSRAVLHILQTLGGGWRLLGWIGRIPPRFLADAFYAGIARVRHRVFSKPERVCPMVSEEVRKRFDP